MASLQTGTNGKGKVPPQGGKVPAKVASTEVAIPEIKAKAMSKDIGPRVLQGLAKANQDIVQGKTLLHSGETAKASYMAELSMAIIKAAKADPSIDLTAAAASGDEASAKKAMTMLGTQLRIVLGIQEVVTIKGKGDKDIKKVAYTKAVEDLFIKAGESRDTPEGKAKETLRTNFATSLRKAACVALGVIERGITAEMDKKAGTLRLTGPEVKKQFGVASVVLDEKQNIDQVNKKGEVIGETKLTTKPSFAAIQRKAEEAHGKVARPAVTNDRTMKNMDPTTAFEAICKALVDAISKIKGKPSERHITAMKTVESAIDPLI